MGDLKVALFYGVVEMIRTFDGRCILVITTPIFDKKENCKKYIDKHHDECYGSIIKKTYLKREW